MIRSSVLTEDGTANHRLDIAVALAGLLALVLAVGVVDHHAQRRQAAQDAAGHDHPVAQGVHAQPRARPRQRRGSQQGEQHRAQRRDQADPEAFEPAVLEGGEERAVLGLAFLGIELTEFAHMIHEGATPQRSAFLSSFFTLVGTHGLHVTFGLVWLVTLMVQTARFGLTTANRRRLMCLSMFWHFLDVVWIGVFTFVYLLGVLR